MNEGLSPLEYQSGVAALYEKDLASEMRWGDLRILLVGDAAGQVKNSTVGGTVTGFAGSLAAVKAIREGSSYRQTSKLVDRELKRHYFIRKLLNEMTTGDYQKLLSLLNQPVHRFLSENDRDAMRDRFWKLPFLQPGFIPLGLRLLLRSIFRSSRVPTS
jgi:flavin-dependent dehydrogenase